MEILSLDPYIVKYYDVISDDDISFIQKTYKPQLKRATIGVVRNIDKLRTSEVAWLSKNESSVTKRLNLQIRSFTGFDLETEDRIQLSHYGPGAHYGEHHDVFCALEYVYILY